jgi:conjugal transfer pilus assembly protein TraI
MALREFMARIAGAAPSPVAPAAAVRPRPAVIGEAVYPPADPGLPACDPEDILAAIHAKVQRLKELVVSDRDQFDVAYLGPIRELAKLVHLLPASADSYYAAPAGLFNLCLDVAFYALQSADGKIFTPGGTVEDRHRNEPRWRYACFLAGLCCQVHRSLTLMTVTDPHGAEWPRFSRSIWAWLEDLGAERYFVNWHAPTNVTGGEGAAVLSLIAPKSRLDWLAQGDVQIVRDMHQVALGAAHDSDSIMASVVGRIAKRVLEVDDAVRRTRYGRLTVGGHVEPYLLDALRAPIESGRWPINKPGSPVWFGSDGLFVEWPGAHAGMLEHFDALGMRGLPRSSVTLAEVLGKADLLIRAESGLWVRDVLLPTREGGPHERRTTAFRFVDPTVLLGHTVIAPLLGPVGAELVEAELRATAAAPAATAKDRKTDAPPAPAGAEPEAKPGSKGAAPAPAATAAAEPVARLNPDPASGEIVFADLVKPEAKRWMTSPDICEAIGQLIHLHKVGRGETAKSFPFGVALSVGWITENTAADLAHLVKVLETNRWLGRPPGVKNDAVKLHEIAFDDKVKQGIVLSVQGAGTLGFKVGTATR